MRPRRIDVIGGGPAGLYAARLLKVARPECVVTVHERMRGSGETFGFGVVLTGSTMKNLVDADPDSATDIRAAGHAGHALRLLRGDQAIDLHGARNLAIGRKMLLEILARHARAAGVVINTGDHVDAATLDADVIIAADGVRSATREKLAGELGAEVTVGRGLYLWCGADFALDDSIFAPARTGDGLFAAHAYPYAPDRSTFLIETDDTSRQLAGMATDHPTTADGSDAYSLAYLQHAFADRLAGHRLLGNRSRWQRFATVHLQRWSHNNIVLIGDAAHTAHYTLGSGTKLAMEDAIALVRALLIEPDAPAAFAAYERSRRTGVERFQHLAARSQRWWESFPQRLRQPLPTIALGFLTRAGNITLDRLAGAGDQPLRDALAAYRGTPLPELPTDPLGWVLDQPATLDGRAFPSRVLTDPAALTDPVITLDWSQPDPWDDPAGTIVSQVRHAPQRLVWVRGHDALPAVQGRIDLAERLKLETGRTVIVQLPAVARAEAAAALACRRCDLVHLTR